MNTRFKKIFLLVAAFLFMGAGVSFAHDRKASQHKQGWHSSGYYKKGHDYRPDKYEKHFYIIISNGS